ncbi:MAG: DEAD/DEAH box helicase family protein [Candidatus Thorarchaeota archaeon]|nr:DEAD/DEAH box helicase family protein [Candidatus Thorarchaeota archaeon]
MKTHTLLHMMEMSGTSKRYTPRGYQEYILQKTVENRNSNLLLELDCGLGKRFITHQIVAQRFPNLRFLIVVHSSSSLVETVQYLRGEYGGLDDELGELSSRTPTGLRVRWLNEKRVIVATPQVLAGVLERHPEAASGIDAVLINEVDTLVRRSGGLTALVYPWPTLLSQLKDKWIIGMSGTLRDDHAVFSKDQVEIRQELATLREYIPNAVLISMEDLYGTDVSDYIEPTLLQMERVTDIKVRSVSIVLDELIRDCRQQIVNELEESDNLGLIEGDSRRIYLLLDTLPVSDELKSQYGGLLMLRKYVYGMPPRRFIRMFYEEPVKHHFNLSQLRRSLPEVSSKAVRVLAIAKRFEKVLVLTSYLEMVKDIQTLLERSGLNSLALTGQTTNKGEVLRAFREDEAVRVLVMSPVGERDLDIPHAQVMVVCDVINTTKTMYQKVKRTRGGLVILLTYSGTSEERKVTRLMSSIVEKYPWSSAIMQTESESLR